MPTIEIAISDFESLLQEKIDRKRLESLLELVKGEVKDFIPEGDIAKLELNDSNRPDLWSPEGIVRQLRRSKLKKGGGYSFFNQKRKADRKVVVSKEVGAVRPYLAACIARGIVMTEPILEQLIQSQEKLAEIFGRKRKTVSIGLYRLQKIAFPVRYDLADPDKTAFIPLGFDAPMSLTEIIVRHPKGIAYADTLQGADRYPILVDAKGEILSFPPIINSREIGEVKVGDAELFIEVTGTDLRMVMLALNIFACNFFDRGAAIEPVLIQFPRKTDYGAAIQMPYDFSGEVGLTLDQFERVLGEPVKMEEVVSMLQSYGYTVRTKGKALKVTAPPYRDDTMHPIDVIEDFAISRGYASFKPEMPSTFTVGSLSQIETLSDYLREAMVGFGFQEVVSNILGSRQDFIEKMKIAQLDERRPEAGIIEIENPMTERFSLLRPWLLPSLLRVEGASSKTFYPHRIFEVGEIARLALPGARKEKAEESTTTSIHLAALIAHPNATFSELHAVLEALFLGFSQRCLLESIRHPSFIEGRAGKIILMNREVGLIGELNPEVLTRWQIGMPCAAFEIEIEKL
ncbi:MAG: phenylalanine--tRNA ligase subunit beta [Nitrospiria bacterium]